MKSFPMGEALVALALFPIALPARAHVTLEVREAAAGSYYKAVFRVTHGCEGSPTVGLRIQIPDGVWVAKPQPKPGWQVTTARRQLAEPVDVGHGRAASEVVREVIWSGGRLLDEHYDEFAVQLRLPDAPGRTLYFPAVQSCQQGEHRWTETLEPSESGHPHGGASHPAPALLLRGAR
jgi:uncharacterized protein YcnI